MDGPGARDWPVLGPGAPTGGAGGDPKGDGAKLFFLLGAGAGTAAGGEARGAGGGVAGGGGEAGGGA